MSKSRSPSPSNIPSFKTGLPSTEKTKSQNEHASIDPSDSGKTPSPAYKNPEPLTLRHSPPTVDESSTRRRRRIAEELSEEPLAKRIRTESPSVSHMSKNQSSPESDSQADMADNEMEVKATDANDQAPPAPPPKKKRTRTLTTPHQSAVLHALLAQSRFPTTAMREEVGRSIGLSARKVQIWFQNQRQKARRPRNQGDSNQPPLYGPLQSSGEPSSSIHRFQNYGPPRPGRSPPEAPSGPSELPSRLLGPGMPGPRVTHPQGYRPLLPASPPIHPAEPSSQGYLLPSPSTPSIYRAIPPAAPPSLSPHPNWRERERDRSRTLPPLLSARPSSSNPLPSFWGRSDTPQHPVPMLYRSLSPEQRVITQHLPEPGPRASLHLPPPFTLQPSPQWDDMTYLPRPSSWSMQQTSHSTRPRSMSPLASRRDFIGSSHRGGFPDTRHAQGSLSSIPSDPPHSRARSGRYDPIRSTFIPYSRPDKATSPMMPQFCRPQAGGQADRDDRPLSRPR